MSVAIIGILLIGPISDKVGRRIGFLTVPIFNSLQALVYLLNCVWINSHPAYMTIGSIMTFVYGDMQGVVVLCYAYAADCSKNKFGARAVRMALVEGSLWLSGVPAALIAGVVQTKFGFRSVFYFTLGVNFLMFLYICVAPSKLKNI